MNAQQDEARSMRLRARMGRDGGTLGAAGDDEAPCGCAPSVGFKSGLALGALVVGTIAFFTGATLADEANRKKR